MPTEKHLRLLGVIFDPLWTFSHHAAAIAPRASKGVNILRTLSNSEFRKDKECLLQTFKIYIQLFSYAAPVVYPNYSPTSIAKLQKVQNCKTILSKKHGSTGTLANHLRRHYGSYTKQNVWKAL